MSSTSRVLRSEEHSGVTAIWWQNTGSPPPDALIPERRSPERLGATAERERIEREAYQRGFSEGTATGKQQAMGELQPVLDRLSHSLADIASLRSRIRRDAEKDLLKLAIAIARRVLHRELTLDPESIEGVIRVAVEKLQARDVSRVRVHPDQEQTIRASLERLSNSHKIEVVADSSLQIGDVLFETAHGTLDASIESQLREIDRGFADRLKK